MSELSDQFAAKLGVNDFMLQYFEANRTLADNLKLESFLTHYPKFTLEQFENFVGSEMEITKSLKEEIKDLEYANDELKEDLADLESQLEEASIKENRPEFDLLVDEQKYELFMSNYKCFTLEDFELFCAKIKEFKAIFK